MKYDAPLYRPPQEADTPLLQVTHGCSYNRCTYCNMYEDNPFGVVPKADITRDIQEFAAKKWPYQRFFLVNGDPFCLSFEKLTWIVEEIRQYIPTVRTVATYASIQNIATKTDEELKALKELGLDYLYLGLESALDEALAFVDKGHSGEEAHRELKRLDTAGIKYSIGIMLGLLGAGHSEEAGTVNGSFFKGLHPDQIWLMSTTVMPKTELARLRDSGEYQETSEYERVQEIHAFLEAFDMAGEETFFNSYHPTNSFRLKGDLPKDKEKLIEECKDVLDNHTEESYQKLFDRSWFKQL